MTTSLTKEATEQVEVLKEGLGEGALKLEPDWAKFESIAKQFVSEANKKVGKVAATKVLEHQKKIFSLTLRAQEGTIGAVAARRSLGRHKRSMTNYLAGVEEKFNWTRAKSFWQAADEILNWALVLGSQLIARI